MKRVGVNRGEYFLNSRTFDKMDKSELTDLVDSWERGLNKIIVNWDLIPGCPKDEFDSLSHKLISHLTKGAKKEKIYNILESELVVRYGLSPNEIELEKFTIEIINWWDSGN